MEKGKKEKKPKQIVFSEEIDSAINGYAIGMRPIAGNNQCTESDAATIKCFSRFRLRYQYVD